MIENSHDLESGPDSVLPPRFSDHRIKNNFRPSCMRRPRAASGGCRPECGVEVMPYLSHNRRHTRRSTALQHGARSWQSGGGVGGGVVAAHSHLLITSDSRTRPAELPERRHLLNLLERRGRSDRRTRSDGVGRLRRPGWATAGYAISPLFTISHNGQHLNIETIGPPRRTVPSTLHRRWGRRWRNDAIGNRMTLD